MSYWKRLLFLVSVEGESAWPEFVPGTQYYASALKTPRNGDYIVFPHPRDNARLLVKKIVCKDGDAYEVAGNLPWASGSREFGPIPKHTVIGSLLR